MSTTLKPKVFVAMSGGVDSSVAALLLKSRGYDITGVFMRCVSDELSRTTGLGASPSTRLRADCTTEVDATDARRVAEKLGIPFYVWDFEEEYKRRVVDYMIDGYRRGITPNPDVMCNREIKFGIFFDRALQTGADFVATGHYVRRGSRVQGIGDSDDSKTLNPIGYTLLAARDAQKDQSYFLWTLTQEKLEHCLFPIGDYLKSEVREIARKAGLPTAEKKDSQGICFLGKITLADFLKQYLPEKRGEVLLALSDVEGNPRYEKIGEHIGAHFYTIGQRQGVGNLKHQKGNTVHAPVYVAEKNIAANTLTVAEGENNPALYRTSVELDKISFISTPFNSNVLKNIRIQVLARVRYRQSFFRATLHISNSRELENSKNNDRFIVKREIIGKLIFEKPQKFVAPGQSAVFYSDSGEMLGGGVIV